MADTSVELLLNKLKDLLVNHAHLIRDSKREIESLEMDLRVIRAFLKDSVKTWRKDTNIQTLVRKIREVVYEAENIIDDVVIHAIEHTPNTSLKNKFFRPPVNLSRIDRKMEAISRQVAEISNEVKQFKIYIARIDDSDGENNYYEKMEVRPPRQQNVVGLEDVTEEIIHRLTAQTMHLDVISVVGMFGLGKTTLAWKIFNDPNIQYEFPVRIWLSISQTFSIKDVLLAILRQIITLTDELRRKDEHELSQMAAGYLERGKFVIVMDDVWKASDWDRLRIALLQHNNSTGKVLITSRDHRVGWYASQPRGPHMMRFLNDKESWELLRLETYNSLNCPSELDDVGKEIARECKGIPLGVVVVGSILAKKMSADVDARRRVWEKVSTQVGVYQNHESPGDDMRKSILLSYDTLPNHLRACFLYLGMFPKDYEIPVSKLVSIWIGEGFIQRDSGSKSLEETAEGYLEDLISRSLVLSDKIKHDGRVKTCRIHDALHDFCTSEAGNYEQENFFQEIKSDDNGVFSPPISYLNKFRRLSIHSDCSRFMSSKPFGPLVRSFVCFSDDELTLPPADASAIPAGFKFLRVLDAKPIKFTMLPNSMYQLVHLRYIVMSVNFSTLPAKFNQLWNIQTLIIDTTSPTLEVKADLWKMIQLRHFKTNASATLSNPSKEGQYGEELQMLGTISVVSCTAELFDGASNLKKLGIRGRLALLFEGKVGSFDHLGRLRRLEKLKLINDAFPEPASQCKLSRFPDPYRFPSTLRSLTLYSTYLSWHNMSTLGLLEKLEVLKLKDRAFMGRTWEALDGGFRHLEFLHIENTDLVAWRASPHHFPRLKSLVLRYCEKLLAIPNALAHIPSFQVLDLFNSRYAAASAREIRNDKEKEQAEDGAIFKLSIYPSI